MMADVRGAADRYVYATSATVFALCVLQALYNYWRWQTEAKSIGQANGSVAGNVENEGQEMDERQRAREYSDTYPPRDV